MNKDNKLCGNCAGDHKLLDCPFIEGRITKIAYKQILKNQEDAEKLIEFEKYHGKGSIKRWSNKALTVLDTLQYFKLEKTQEILQKIKNELKILDEKK